jgi:hypothetical protein
VEDEIIEVVALGEAREVLACLRRMIVVEFDYDSALVLSVLFQLV